MRSWVVSLMIQRHVLDNETRAAVEIAIVVTSGQPDLESRRLWQVLGRFAQRLSTNRPEAQATNVCRTPSFLLVLLEIDLT